MSIYIYHISIYIYTCMYVLVHSKVVVFKQFWAQLPSPDPATFEFGVDGQLAAALTGKPACVRACTYEHLCIHMGRDREREYCKVHKSGLLCFYSGLL